MYRIVHREVLMQNAVFMRLKANKPLAVSHRSFLIIGADTIVRANSYDSRLG